MSKLIRLADVVDDKIRKEKELEFYEKELQKLLSKRVDSGTQLRPLTQQSYSRYTYTRSKVWE
ncbi:MAG: hypothetical protein EBW60_05300 [Rhodobacteraceae bacterium]|nr:hypothetical protein [Paracoccaceae bacterium]